MSTQNTQEWEKDFKDLLHGHLDDYFCCPGFKCCCNAETAEEIAVRFISKTLQSELQKQKDDILKIFNIEIFNIDSDLTHTFPNYEREEVINIINLNK